jgi:hypothetical protein
VYLGRAKMPFLWVAGTNDFAYPMDSLQKSYRLPRTTRTLVIRVRMPHGHMEGATPEEIHAFADEYMKSGAPLVSIRDQGRTGRRVWANYSSTKPVIRAQLNYTLDAGVWQHRHWQTMPADLGHGRSAVNVTLPEGIKVYYFNLIDERGLIVSSEHAVIP